MRRYWWGIAALHGALTAVPAASETLTEALVRTNATNPVLAGERARLRSIEEDVAIARSEGGLHIGGTAGLVRNVERTGTAEPGALTGGVDADYRLFAGGGVRNAVRAAKLRVASARAGLRAVEGAVFVETVRAYVDIIRDDAIAALGADQVRVLEADVAASGARLRYGDATGTDRAQSEARLAGARGRLAAARSQQVASREEYRRLTGAWPAMLERPPPLPRTPATPQEAVHIALSDNSELAAARLAARAAAVDVQVERADRLPAISLGSGAGYRRSIGEPGAAPWREGTDLRVGLTARIPLYQGGAVAARVRQARSRESRANEQVIAVERGVIADVRSAYASLAAATGRLESRMAAVGANEQALRGVRAGNMVGTHSILDVLNAEQELLDARTLLVAAHRDEYVAAFTLLDAMGQMDADTLAIAEEAATPPSRHVLAYDIGALIDDAPSLPQRTMMLDYDFTGLWNEAPAPPVLGYELANLLNDMI